MMIRLIISFFITLLFALNSTSIPSLSAFSETLPADTLIQMERTTCFGTCPSYELTIHGNGSVIFEGKQFVAHKGIAEGEISQEKLNQILELVEEINYMQIPSEPECESWATDLPTVFLTIKIDGEQNSITHYKGCIGFDQEDELDSLEAVIDRQAGVEKWID